MINIFGALVFNRSDLDIEPLQHPPYSPDMAFITTFCFRLGSSVTWRPAMRQAKFSRYLNDKQCIVCKLHACLSKKWKKTENRK